MKNTIIALAAVALLAGCGTAGQNITSTNMGTIEKFDIKKYTADKQGKVCTYKISDSIEVRDIGLIETINNGNGHYFYCILQRQQTQIQHPYTVEYYFLRYLSKDKRIFIMPKRIEYHDIHYFRYEEPDAKWEDAGYSTDDTLWAKIFEYYQKTVNQ
jgi:uncharacterized protein YceK